MLRPSAPSQALFQRSSLVAAALCLMAFVPPARAAQDFSHPDTRPSPQAGLVQQANDAIAAGNFAAALTLLTTLNTQIPNDPQVLYDLGFTLESLPSATPPSSLTPESCYRASIAADPGFAPSHAALGLLLARANHPAEARAQLLAATQLPAEPALEGRALRAIARIDLAGIPGDAEHAVAPNPAAASDDLLAALKLTREQPADILLSAEIAEAAADLPAAEQAYRRYLALPGNNADPAPTAALVHVLLAERHYAEAEAVLGPALARDPGNPSLTAQLAEADLASGDDAQIAKAVPMVEALRAKNPGSPVLTRLLARVYVETGHPDEADPLYAALLSTDPAHPDPTLLVDRAETLLLLHRPGEAERLLKQAVANPAAFPAPAAFADAATQLAFAASEIDDPRTTLQALALRATVQPPSPSSLFLEATANDDLHQSSKAAELYKQFLAAAHGTLPDQESQVRKRLAELDSRK